jgi:hypothetical protein
MFGIHRRAVSVFRFLEAESIRPIACGTVGLESSALLPVSATANGTSAFRAMSPSWITPFSIDEVHRSGKPGSSGQSFATTNTVFGVRRRRTPRLPSFRPRETAIEAIDGPARCQTPVDLVDDGVVEAGAATSDEPSTRSEAHCRASAGDPRNAYRHRANANITRRD